MSLRKSSRYRNEESAQQAVGEQPPISSPVPTPSLFNGGGATTLNVRPKIRAMWTIDREREKEHARKFLGFNDPSALETVIDAVHDLMVSGAVTEQTTAAFRRGFIDGGGGTWESTGSWLRKAAREYPVLSELWLEFASHRSATKRFRVAAFVRDMPEEVARTLFLQCLSDSSAKVRSKVAADQHDTKCHWVAPLLRERRVIETDASVLESIDFALDSINENPSRTKEGEHVVGGNGE
jgi:hypothetical protein